MQTPLRILVVDDSTLVRRLLRQLLESDPDVRVVGEAADGHEALAQVVALRPDLITLDVRMPSMDGVETTRQIKRASPRTQVVVLTSYHSDEHIFPVLRAGALSYVLKDVGVDALADAIRKAVGGEAVLHPRVAARVIHELQGNSQHPPNAFAELSERELGVLRLVAQGLSNADIAGRLVLSEKTVKGHVSNILSKLHVADRTQAAVYAWREGVVRRDGG